jgi:hypothetical protein
MELEVKMDLGLLWSAAQQDSDPNLHIYRTVVGRVRERV